VEGEPGQTGHETPPQVPQRVRFSLVPASLVRSHLACYGQPAQPSPANNGAAIGCARWLRASGCPSTAVHRKRLQCNGGVAANGRECTRAVHRQPALRFYAARILRGDMDLPRSSFERTGWASCANWTGRANDRARSAGCAHVCIDCARLCKVLRKWPLHSRAQPIAAYRPRIANCQLPTAVPCRASLPMDGPR
jgi:hypothetical protein